MHFETHRYVEIIQKINFDVFHKKTPEFHSKIYFHDFWIFNVFNDFLAIFAISPLLAFFCQFRSHPPFLTILIIFYEHLKNFKILRIQPEHEKNLRIWSTYENFINLGIQPKYKISMIVTSYGSNKPKKSMTSGKKNCAIF